MSWRPQKTWRMRSIFLSFCLFTLLIHTVFTVFTCIVKPEPGRWRDVKLAEFHDLQNIHTIL